MASALHALTLEGLTAMDRGDTPWTGLCRALREGFEAFLVAYVKSAVDQQRCWIQARSGVLPASQLSYGKSSSGELRHPERAVLIRHSTDIQAWQESGVGSAGTDPGVSMVGIPLGRAYQVATHLTFLRADQFSGLEMRAVQDLQRALIAFEAHVCLWERRDPALEIYAHSPNGMAASQRLTARERQVIQLLSKGMLASTIAARLHVSPRTVHAHLGSAYRKLEAHDRLTAVNRARQIGIIGGAHLVD